MTTHTDVVRINELAAELMTDAKQHRSRRSSRTLVAGSSQRATVIGMSEGAELSRHESPPAATVQVLAGRVALYTTEREWSLGAGEWLTVPVERHGVRAVEDGAILLTVALR